MFSVVGNKRSTGETHPLSFGDGYLDRKGCRGFCAPAEICKLIGEIWRLVSRAPNQRSFRWARRLGLMQQLNTLPGLEQSEETSLT
jgi:hypothetical protein